MSEPNQPALPRDDDAFVPSEYTRTHYPELFSDSYAVQTATLDKGRLEYHLETLTSRKQEQEFEEFCRRIVELEICPNIVPQTGPTGGGDSKTDASTYPVAPILAERVWWGTPASAAPTQWAFAFSAKKAWKPKVKEDAAKIAGLSAKPTDMFFISNQFIKDKDRAFLEAELTKKHSFKVHILDKSWIVKTVIEHRREAVAIQTLGITGAEAAQSVMGPKDVARQRELDTLMTRFRDPSTYRGNDYALAQDYQQAALLARGLERPRHEVDGLFERAFSIAKKHGYKGQILRIGCDYAWTSLWWYDDAVKQEELYRQFEHCIEGTVNAENCSLLLKQWMVLNASWQLGKLSDQVANAKARLLALRTELDCLAGDRTRPINALMAKSDLHLADLVTAMNDQSRLKSALHGLRDCLREAVALGPYPFDDLSKFLIKAGEFLGDLPGYDAVFDEVQELVRRRRGERDEGRLLLERGEQLLKAGCLKDGLKRISQARSLLFKDESMKEGIWATLLCAETYSSLGLHWAARMDALTAAHASLHSVEAMDDYALEAVLACIKLGWIELTLGRVIPFIAWYRLSGTLINRLPTAEYDPKRLREKLSIQQGVLGCLFLAMDRPTAEAYLPLAEVLESSGLPMARLALLFACGDTHAVLTDWPFQEDATETNVHELFAMWKKQPAMMEVPSVTVGPTAEFVECSSTVFGVNYRLNSRNELAPLSVAENILGVIEAVLVFADWTKLAFIVDEVLINVDMAEDGKNPPDVKFPDFPNEQNLSSIWKMDMLDWLTKTDRSASIEYLKTVFFTVLLTATIDPLSDLKEEIDRWYRGDAASRAFGTSPIVLQLLDLLGKDGYDVSRWGKPANPS